MSGYLVFFVTDPVDDDLAAAIRKRVRATDGAGWFDDPDAATPAERTAGGYVRVGAPEEGLGQALLTAAKDVSALHGVVVEVQWREEVIGRIEGGELLSAGAPRSDRRDASPGSSP